MTEFTATILLGTSLSAAVLIAGGTVIRIEMPEAWDAAGLSFEVSSDGADYDKLYKEDGSEYTVSAAADRAIMIDPTRLAGVKYLKVRSGTASVPVLQTADRSITLVTVLTW